LKVLIIFVFKECFEFLLRQLWHIQTVFVGIDQPPDGFTQNKLNVIQVCCIPEMNERNKIVDGWLAIRHIVL